MTSALDIDDVGPGELAFTPSTRVLWRSSSQVQLELGARRLVIDGLTDAAVDRLASAGHRSTTPSTGSDDDQLTPLLQSLLDAGFLSRADRAASGSDDDTIDIWAAAHAGLAPEVAALGERFGDQRSAVMHARQERTVAIEGTGRLPAMIGALLAAAGIGHVHVGGDRDVGLWDVAPGGLVQADEGRRTAAASADAIHRFAAAADTRWVPHSAVDLLVLAGSSAAGPAQQSALMGLAKPHLSATVWASSAVIGPLVVPGVTSCLGCADLHRAERDPAWPALAAQISAVRRVPTDVAVCMFASAFAALQALAFLDGEQPATVDATLEMSLPDWRVRRRSWPAHERCACQRNP